MTGSNEPGVTTLRILDMNQQQQQQQQQHQQRDQFARETDIEVCFVCKKCRVAFSSESYLLTHQRQCFGGNLDNRGAYRLVQLGYECKICPGDRYKSQYDYKKHTECETHCFRVQQQQQHQQQQQQQQHKLLAPPPPSESPLSHEMEDVVNQITLLAARAAQEAGSDTTRGTVDSNSNTFCQPGEPKRRFLTPAADVPQPLTSAGH